MLYSHPNSSFHPNPCIAKNALFAAKKTMCISFFWINALFLELANLNLFGRVGALCPKGVGSWERIRQGELKNALFSPLTTKTQRVGARDIRLQRMPYGMKGELLCDVDRSLGVLVYA